MTRTRLGYGNAEGLSRKNKQAKIVTLSVQKNVGGSLRRAELSMGWQIGATERTSHIELNAWQIRHSQIVSVDMDHVSP
jgi:hypothetical protein